MAENITKIIPCAEVAPAVDQAQIAAWAQRSEDRGADAVMINFEREVKENPAEYFNAIRECARLIDIPIWVRASYFRLEDVKKLLYAGAERCVFYKDDAADMEMYTEAMLRFGTDRCVCLSETAVEAASEEMPAVAPEVFVSASVHSDLPALLAGREVDALLLNMDRDEDCDFYALKNALADAGIRVDRFESSLDPAGFKYDEKGLIPVVVQDARTDEVLMMAYMNEESFHITCATGRMTYFSRSRQSLWVKGETSGCYQYVRSLAIDCDQDTILAKVRQVGAACHTGNRSCFYTPLVTKEGNHPNPEKVLNEVYAVIKDRKDHPREGSYTNYLFDKGVDKILKKLGEEATEIVIAAKNPEPEEIIYEVADFMYHLMVLMADKGLTWDDIMEELSKRESSK